MNVLHLTDYTDVYTANTNVIDIQYISDYRAFVIWLGVTILL